MVHIPGFKLQTYFWTTYHQEGNNIKLENENTVTSPPSFQEGWLQILRIIMASGKSVLVETPNLLVFMLLNAIL